MKIKLAFILVLIFQVFFLAPWVHGEESSFLVLWSSSGFYLQGQSVYLSGILEGERGPISGEDVGILVINPSGGPFFADQLNTDSSGFFSTDFRLPEGALLGSYAVQGCASGAFTNSGFRVVTQLPPLPPSNLSAFPGLNSVYLSWSPSSSPSASYYLVYRKSPGEGQFTRVATTSSLEYFDSSAPGCGLPYAYAVSAADSSGFEGDLSQAVTAVPWDQLSSFRFDPISTPQISGVPFKVSIQAVDRWGVKVGDFSSPVSLSLSPGISATISPTLTEEFQRGEWNGNLVLSGTGSVCILASYLNFQGLSNEFLLQEPPPKSIYLHSGWNLISLPFETSPYPTEVFSSLPQPWRAYWWDPSTLRYLSKDQPFISPGRGFWVKSPVDFLLSFEGEELNAQGLTRELFPGWNLVGVPFPRTFSFGEVFFVTSTATYDFPSAVSAGLIRNAAYSWEGSGYVNAYKTGTGLEPFKGYWLKVLKPCKISFFKEELLESSTGLKALSSLSSGSYPVSLSLSFQNSMGIPITPPFRRGSTVMMVATIQNNSSQTLPFLLLFNPLDPSGAPFSFSTISGTIGPNQQAVVSSSLSFPSTAPLGNYLIRVFAWNSWPSQSWEALSYPSTAICELIP